MGKNIIALDVGTQSTRAAVVGVDGDIRGVAQIKHDVDSPRTGWAQQRPDSWWEEICQASRDVLSQTGIQLGIGMALGLGLSLLLGRGLSFVLFGVESVDAGVMAGVAALLSVTAVVAWLVPARRATKVDPMVAMQAE